jgi:hypothetical protein
MIQPVLTRLDRALRRRSFPYLKWAANRTYRTCRQADRSPLIIHQMGKVGSSTLVRSLETIETGRELFQVHVMTWDWIHKVEGQYRHASKVRGRPILDEHILASRYLRTLMDKAEPGRRWQVITLIRDPIARNISTFFQGFPIYFPHLAGKTEGDEALDLRIDELVDVFLNQYLEHEAPSIWYDTHFKPVFGLDVFDTPFDPEQGYQIYRTDTADVLLIRLEDFNRVLSSSLSAFLDLRIAGIQDANISADKSYSRTYRRFRDRIDLPVDYVDRIYGSRFARHFYSQSELDRFRKRWLPDPGTG